MRAQLAEKYIRGHGIEIGGLHFPTELPPGCICDFVDRPLETVKKNHGDVMPKDYAVIEDDAEVLAKFKPESQDFLIANHVLEHCHDPIGTLIVWAKVVRKGGIIFCALPEKHHTFDKPRAITQIGHLYEDFASGPRSTDDSGHYREWFSLIDKLEGQALEQRITAASVVRDNIHFHVWDYAAMQALFTCPLLVEWLEVVEGKVHGAEVIWILRVK